MNQLASTFGLHDIQLSPANLEHIDDLNTRWKLLQVPSHTSLGYKKHWKFQQICAHASTGMDNQFIEQLQFIFRNPQSKVGNEVFEEDDFLSQLDQSPVPSSTSP